MDQKIVSHAVSLPPVPTADGAVAKALQLLVAKGGVFRTDEKWVYTSLRPLINAGYVNVSGNVLTIGTDFDTYLLSASRTNSEFIEIYTAYREWLLSNREQLSDKDNEVLDALDHFPTADQKIMYLGNLVSELSGSVNALTEIVENCVASINDLTLALNVVESVIYNENTDK